MSNTPFFLTGAMAQIRVAGVTMAYCTDIGYSISVRHAAPKVLGMFESFTQQPLSYDVTGQFRVIRYTKGLKSYLTNGGAHVGFSADINDGGNGVGAWTPDNNKATMNNVRKTLLGGSEVNGRADQSLDPSKLYWPQFFDIEIFQQAQISGNSNSQSSVLNPTAAVNPTEIAKGLANNVFRNLNSNSSGIQTGMVARIRNARIVKADFMLAKKGPAMCVYTFQACYADEDSFLATESGLGQNSLT